LTSPVCSSPRSPRLRVRHAVPLWTTELPWIAILRRCAPLD